MIEPLLAELGWHAVALDQRGHGESSKPDDEAAYSFDAFADDLLAVLGALGWEQAAEVCTTTGTIGTAEREAAWELGATVALAAVERTGSSRA